LHEWFVKEEENAPLANLAAVPATIWGKEWAKASVENNVTNVSDGVGPMDKLDVRMKRLRSCYSEEAVEKASLKVAESLLEVAASRDCQNPILTIQLAVLFASQGQKGGTGDQIFKRKLPPRENCSALDALITIGRADCLHAIHFLLEAAYLCSFVASVCSLHRDRLEEDYEWNNCWRIVSILNYDVSVVIRNAAITLGFEPERREETSGIWERDVIDELLRARSDGILWRETMDLKVPKFANAPRARTLICRKTSTVDNCRKPESENSDTSRLLTYSEAEHDCYDTQVDLQVSTFEELCGSQPHRLNEDENDIQVVEV
jgi:hypothetical protein